MRFPTHLDSHLRNKMYTDSSARGFPSCCDFLSESFSRKPLFRSLDVVLAKLPAALMPRDGNVGAAAFENRREFFCLSPRNGGIQARSADEHRNMAEVTN